MFFMTARRPVQDSANDPWVAHRRLSRMIDDAFGGLPFWIREDEGTVTSSWVPVVDISEDAGHLKLVAEVPGVRPEDVKISIENTVLTIRGEKKQIAEEKTERVHRYERAYGAFERSFTLPTTIDADRIEATYRDGVLTVTLPKVERARPREIPVVTS